MENVLLFIFIIIAIICIVFSSINKKKKENIDKEKKLAEEQKKFLELRDKFAKNGIEKILPNNLILEKNEECYFENSAKYAELKNRVIGYETNSRGNRIRITKGFSVYGGGSTRQSIRDDILITTEGTIYLTNKKIIFSAIRHSTTIKLVSILSLDTYKGLLVIQTKSKEFSFHIEDQTTFMAELEYLLNKKNG